MGIADPIGKIHTGAQKSKLQPWKDTFNFFLKPKNVGYVRLWLGLTLHQTLSVVQMGLSAF
jgi:hypothetical protein